MKKANTYSIMMNAHKMTRECLRAFPSADYRATLSIALRYAWKDETALPAEEAWRAMSDDEKAEALRRMAWYRRERSAAECNRAGEFRPDHYSWISGPDDIDMVVNGAFVRMVWGSVKGKKHVPALLETAGETPLAIIMSNACDAEARAVWRETISKPHALRGRHDENGDYVQYVVDHAAPIAEPIEPSPESYTITRDTIERACRDDVDRLIADLRAAGFTQGECAEAADIGRVAVTRRLQRLRDRAAEAAEDARECLRVDPIAAEMAAGCRPADMTNAWNDDNSIWGAYARTMDKYRRGA